MDKPRKRLGRLFQRTPALDMATIRSALGGRSRRSVFRDLAALGYLSSYSHAGRYYTLAEIPRFDEYCLWAYESICFSSLGTLKATVVHLVSSAPAGYLHAELQALLRIRVHNTALGLVRTSRIGRELLAGRYLYVSVDPNRAAEQVSRRREQTTRVAMPSPTPSSETVIAVLVEALQAGVMLAAPAVVAARLTARGMAVTADRVRQVYEHCGLDPEKKTPEPPLPPSRS